MDKFYKRNIPYKLVSFLLAVLVWVYVTNEMNPSDSLVTHVAIEPVALAKDLAVMEMPATVKVRFQGKRNLASAVNNKEVRAFVNLNKAGTGENLLPVEVVVPSGFQVVEKNPAMARVVLDEMDEKQIPVIVRVNGKPMPGYKNLPPLFEPSQIRIGGPKKLIDRIDRAEVVLDIQGQAKTTSQVMPALLYDKENLRIDGTIKITPANIDLTVPILKEKEVKLVQVQPVMVGDPAPGFQIASVVVEPTEVYLQGPSDALDRINNISTGEINVAGINSDTSKEALFQLPEGVTTKAKTARVFIQVIPQPVQKTFYPVPVVLENIPPEMKVVVEPQVVNVTLEGKLDNLEPKEIKAFVDLEGLEKGEHQVNVQVIPMEELSLVKVDPRLVTITLE